MATHRFGANFLLSSLDDNRLIASIKIKKLSNASQIKPKKSWLQLRGQMQTLKAAFNGQAIRAAISIVAFTIFICILTVPTSIANAKGYLQINRSEQTKTVNEPASPRDTIDVMVEFEYVY